MRNNDWDEATFKQYIVDAGIKKLKPLNPRYDLMDITPGTVLVGVVIKKLEENNY